MKEHATDRRLSRLHRAGAWVRAATASRSRLLLATTVVWGALLLLGGVTYEASSRDWFCATCHVMDEAIASHERSAHKDTPCRDCHLPGGVGERAGFKVGNGFSALAYMAGSEPAMGPVEMPDLRCLRPGCHKPDERDTTAGLKQAGVSFRHDQHGKRRDGTAMPCASCHNKAGSRMHMGKDRDACTLCHMKSGLPPKLDRCSSCHIRPPRTVQLVHHEKGKTFEHDLYCRNSEACTLCHGKTRTGDGALKPDLPPGVNPTGSSAEAHAAWPPSAGHRCTLCHKALIHESGPPEAELAGEFDSSDALDWAIAVYTGRMKGSTASPDKMFRRRVRCRACHRPTDRSLREVDGTRCRNCHADGMEKLVVAQGTTFRLWTANLDAGWNLYGEALGQTWTAEDVAAYKKLRDQIRGATWAHNIPWARTLVYRAEKRLEEGTEGAFRPILAPLWEVSRTDRACFWRCHMDVPFREKAGEAPLAIAHRKHLEVVRLRCRRCHREEKYDGAPKNHGRLTIVKKDCLACHHIESEVRGDCKRCHPTQDRIFRGEGVPGGGVTRRKNCPEVACGDCHKLTDGTSSREEVLATCAGCHKASRAVTLDAWQNAVKRRLAPLRERLKSLADRLGPTPEANPAVGSFYGQARSLLDAVRRDGSGGGHNVRYTLAIISRAEAWTAKAEAGLKDK